MNTQKSITVNSPDAAAAEAEGTASSSKTENHGRTFVTKEKKSYLFFKRVFDIFCAVFGITVLLLPLLIIALIIVIDSPGASPIYSQQRVGKNGKTFKFYKFRSMVPNADKMLDSLLDKNEMEGPAFKMKDDPRITRFGKFIRKTSIDELPQLWNVLLGSMSMVGPRPPLPREVALYTVEQYRRLSVKPGITCYWQVQPSRNSLSFDEWLSWDMRYIKDRSMKTDIVILLKTVGIVFNLEGQ